MDMFDKQIIAEIGSVHDGSFGNACKLVEAASACGATVVKFQTHIAEAETLRSAPSPSYFKGEPRFDYFQRTAFDKAQYLDLIALCRSLNVRFLSSPFSLEAIDFLQDVGVDLFKVPSGEVSNVPMLEHLTATGKPVILSSGMSNWAELDRAVDVLRSGGPLGVMQCTSEYPCHPENVGLNILEEMKERYGLPVGFSDHANGHAAAFASVALGATFVEKHFTFSRLMYGSDAANGMEPDDFKVYCNGVKEIWSMLERPVNKDDLTAFGDMKKIFEKSLVTSQKIEIGDILSLENLSFKKPGSGIPAAAYKKYLGREVLVNLDADHMLEEEDLK